MKHNTERIHSDTHPSEKKAIQDILGVDTFKKRDVRPTLFPEISEGAGGIELLRAHALPSDVLGAFRGKRQYDITLSPENAAVRAALKKRGHK